MQFSVISKAKRNPQDIRRCANEALDLQQSHPNVRQAMAQTKAPRTLIVLVEQVSSSISLIVISSTLT